MKNLNQKVLPTETTETVQLTHLKSLYCKVDTVPEGTQTHSLQKNWQKDH